MERDAEADQLGADFGAEHRITASLTNTMRDDTINFRKYEFEEDNIWKRMSTQILRRQKNLWSNQDVRDCVARGICKVNFATELRKAYTNALRKALKENTEIVYDSRPFMCPVKEDCVQAIMDKIGIFSSENKA